MAATRAARATDPARGRTSSATNCPANSSSATAAIEA